MNQNKRKPRFKKCETGYHKYAVMQLAEWVNGKMEVPFEIDGQIAFVPDVVTNDRLYEVVHSNPIHGRKLALMQYWSYRNRTDLVVFEVSAEFILRQTEKPEIIEPFNCYIISCYETT